tara:strand:+ start:113 stop:304 length:192 start_codon:yes stop_codon:yes gene_type:complete
MAKEKINLKTIKNKNSRKLEQLLKNPKKVEKLAKKEYGNNWKIIYSGESHYLNSQTRKEWNKE